MAPAMVSQSKSSNKRSFRWRTLRLSVTGCLSSNRLRSMIIVQFHLVEHSCCNLFFVKFKHSLVNVAVATVLWLKKETIARQRSRICIRSALLSIASLTAKLRVWAKHDTRTHLHPSMTAFFMFGALSVTTPTIFARIPQRSVIANNSSLRLSAVWFFSVWT